MRLPAFSLTALVLTAPLAAQLPADVAVVLEPAVPGQPNYRLVDLAGRGTTQVLGQSVSFGTPPVSVAVDPTVPDHFFFMALVGFPGVFRNNVGLLGRINGAQWGFWLRVAGDRVDVGTSRMVTLRAGVVEAFVKQPTTLPNPAIPLFTLPGAVDVAVAEPSVYVATNSGAVVEFNMVTGVQRTVGNYAAIRSLAVSPFGNELCVGLVSGDLHRIDPATGNITATVSTGLGALVAVGYTRFGTLAWADNQQLWSELQPTAPVWTSSTSIIDFGISTATTATATPFGVGCGLGAAATWSVPGRPTLGATNFALGLRDAPPVALTLLVTGSDRAVSSVLGVPLPFALGSLGAAGCSLLVDPLVLTAGVTDLFGERDQPLPIPNSSALAGVELCGQWFVADGAVGSLGLAATAGLAVVIR
ncbi:MAG: hypothetical protein MUC36_16415 [Planctomycetes bacterium]|jgi:hypothetical protein|nr:hypothetical protein [Planctomycetota bacterium]